MVGRLSGHSKEQNKACKSTVTQCTASVDFSDLATSCSSHLLRTTKILIKDQGFESKTYSTLAQGSSLALVGPKLSYSIVRIWKLVKVGTN